MDEIERQIDADFEALRRAVGWMKAQQGPVEVARGKTPTSVRGAGPPHFRSATSIPRTCRTRSPYRRDGPGGEPLHAVALQGWEAFWRSRLPEVLDGVDGVDRLQVDRWVRLLDEHERVWAVVEAVPTVDGSQGQPRPHPQTKYLTEIRNRIERCESVLGLTPQDRLRLGITSPGQRVTADQIREEIRRRVPNE